tara:strand:+ start:2109 stop:2852 length:744 start_codon:yes stop_codon:yes gene_type:complete
MPWIDDSSLVAERGMTGATGNIYCGLHEFADMSLLLHYFSAPDETDRFYDIGANVGSYSLLAGKVCKVPGLAFEPVPTTFNALERNLKTNELEGLIHAKRTAVGASSEWIKFSTDRGPTNQVVDHSYKGSSQDVPVITLDSLIGESPVASFWKIDVEGFEMEVLEGAKESLQSPRVNVILLEETSVAIAAIMSDAGFRQMSYDPFSRELISATSETNRNNQVWIRNPEKVQERCRNAPKREILGVEF